MERRLHACQPAVRPRAECARYLAGAEPPPPADRPESRRAASRVGFGFVLIVFDRRNFHPRDNRLSILGERPGRYAYPRNAVRVDIVETFGQIAPWIITFRGDRPIKRSVIHSAVKSLSLSRWAY